ncbi:uncharacterized protein LOC127121835 [Lathyrus oleraceus]|uniref:uncharacterized protein LOC127121835 n=1 Tax=Pisum sativum TaxID=3888 RepID=UPI0021CED61C|nr:uncharacterized protein LOC127121835 [Pisum sativum]
MLVSKCRIYDKDSRADYAYYKSIRERKVKNQYHGKLYSDPADKWKQRVSYDKKPSGGETHASINCFKCGESDHHASECMNKFLRCFKCGKTGHHIAYYKSDGPTCYNCSKQGHISTKCQKSKKVQSRGKVFALTRSETTILDKLIQGTCFINSITLIVVIDTSATHSFISLDYDDRLGLNFSGMVGSMVIDTPTNGSLEFNSVHINSYDQTIPFPEFNGSDELFVSTKQVDNIMKVDVRVFMLLDSMKDERKTMIG